MHRFLLRINLLRKKEKNEKRERRKEEKEKREKREENKIKPYMRKTKQEKKKNELRSLERNNYMAINKRHVLNIKYSKQKQKQRNHSIIKI